MLLPPPAGAVPHRHCGDPAPWIGTRQWLPGHQCRAWAPAGPSRGTCGCAADWPAGPSPTNPISPVTLLQPTCPLDLIFISLGPSSILTSQTTPCGTRLGSPGYLFVCVHRLLLFPSGLRCAWAAGSDESEPPITSISYLPACSCFHLSGT